MTKALYGATTIDISAGLNSDIEGGVINIKKLPRNCGLFPLTVIAIFTFVSSMTMMLLIYHSPITYGKTDVITALDNLSLVDETFYGQNYSVLDNITLVSVVSDSTDPNANEGFDDFDDHGLLNDTNYADLIAAVDKIEVVSRHMSDLKDYIFEEETIVDIYKIKQYTQQSFE
jgi:hypothetical protein